MDQKTTGFILRKVQYSDSSHIINAYTLDKGRQDYFLRKQKSRRNRALTHLISPLNQLEFDIDARPKRQIQSIKDIRLKKHALYMDQSPAKSAIIFFMSEVLYRSLREEEENPDTYRFIEHTILLLNQIEKGFQMFPLIFITLLTRYLGFTPLLSQKDKKETPGYFNLYSGLFEKKMSPNESMGLKESQLLNDILENGFHITSTYYHKKTRENFLDNMLLYYKTHLEGIKHFKSVDVLREIFA